MKRRTFIQSLAAVLSLPAGGALPLRSATAALPTAAAAVPNKARFWAIYMSSLHGECTPQTLHNLLHIPKVDAKRYVSQLIAYGVIKPSPLLQKTATELVKTKNDSLMEKVKKRSDMKAQAKADKPPIDKAEIRKAVDTTDDDYDEVEYSEEFSDSEPEDAIDDLQLEGESTDMETDAENDPLEVGQSEAIDTKIQESDLTPTPSS